MKTNLKLLIAAIAFTAINFYIMTVTLSKGESRSKIDLINDNPDPTPPIPLKASEITAAQAQGYVNAYNLKTDTVLKGVNIPKDVLDTIQKVYANDISKICLQFGVQDSTQVVYIVEPINQATKKRYYLSTASMRPTCPKYCPN